MGDATQDPIVPTEEAVEEEAALTEEEDAEMVSDESAEEEIAM